jgi:hypothetical protein
VVVALFFILFALHSVVTIQKDDFAVASNAGEIAAGAFSSFSTESTAGSTDHCNTALSLPAGVSKPKVYLGR